MGDFCFPHREICVGASSIYFILLLARAFSLSSFCSASSYIRAGLCYTAGSSFTSSPQGSGQVERKTYITVLAVSPPLGRSAGSCIPLAAVCVVLRVRLMLQVRNICSELAEEAVKTPAIRTLYKRMEENTLRAYFPLPIRSRSPLWR